LEKKFYKTDTLFRLAQRQEVSTNLVNKLTHPSAPDVLPEPTVLVWVEDNGGVDEQSSDCVGVVADGEVDTSSKNSLI
jgi:hypothetical protein